MWWTHIIYPHTGAHNKRRKGEGGKEREAPTHLIEISEPTHAAHVTKARQTTFIV